MASAGGGPGLEYVTAIAAPLVVSLTVNPVLCSLLHPWSKAIAEKETWLLRRLHALYRPTLDWALSRRRLVIGAALALVPVFFAGTGTDRPARRANG